MQLDRQQKEAVNVRRNAVVTAGAGSGKTRVLAERYVRLVHEDQVPVDEILTLTFTRKAAAEMYERIYRALTAFRDDEFVAQQLGHFEHAQISTVDSFCAQIARNGCSRYGVPTGFRVDEEEVDTLAEDTALAFLLENRNNPVLARFVAINGFQDVWKQGFAELARSYVLVSRRQDPQGALSKQFRELGRLYRQRVSELQEQMGLLLSLEPALKAIGEAQKAFAEITLDPGWDPRTAQSVPEGFDAFIGAVGELSKQVGRSKKEAAVLYKECVDRIRELRTDLEELVKTAQVREELGELYQLVASFEEQVRSEKRRRGLLSYRDVMELAVDLLRSDAALLDYYNERFSFVMIDEFQDNNALQKNLLYLLSLSSQARERRAPPETQTGASADATGGASAAATPGASLENLVDAEDLEPEKLFFVGDEKQSIYRFRGADVGVFKQLSDEIADAGGRALELPFNYRSRPRLISFFNRICEKTMADAAASYEARFAPLEAPADDEADSPPRITVAYKRYDEAGDTDEVLGQDEAEAYYVAKSIREAIDAGTWTLPTEEGGGTRAAEFDDVAVLMRSTSNQRHYERMFRLFGVPYSTQSVRSLFEGAAAHDLYNVLQLCIYPEDRAAYAAVLRSPLVNVSDEALSRLLLDENTPFSAESAVELSEEDAAKYARGAELYGELRARVDEQPVSVVVSDFWYLFGYRYKLLGSPRFHPYLEYFDYLYELARSMDDRPMYEFVEALRANLGNYGRRRELEVVRDAQRGVQLLTIHGAKGLEFPVVVLANTGNVGRKESMGTKPFYLSDEFGLTASMPASGEPLAKRERVNYFFLESERENEAMEHAELKRLLYVALTRAESHLLITGVFNRNNRNSEGHLLNLVLGSLDIDPQDPQDSHVSLGSAGVEIKRIPDVSRSAAFMPAEAHRGPTLEDAAAAYSRAELTHRSAVSREISVTELAERYRSLQARAGLEAGAGAGPGVGVDDDGRTGADEELPSLACDPLIEERRLATFFGTLTHHIIETSLTEGSAVRDGSGGGKGSGKAPPYRDLPPKLRRPVQDHDISQAEYARMSDDAERLACGFLESTLAGALSSAYLESEVPFVLHRHVGSTEAWIHGQIDLLAENGGATAENGATGGKASGGAVTVVDFKTDRIYSPQAHRLQLSIYREAAEELTGTPVRAVVYYLRNGAIEEAGPTPSLSEELLGTSKTI